mmetsp:Transcript_7818/g.20661  ORF Transcript_7818/g.20661 Transcript_7818/m.20661 type:complete len:271 (+) Transcript_7818:367-1179(+)
MGDGVQSYLCRIGLDGNPSACDAERLAVLHAAHVQHVPYETIDLRLGIPIALDFSSVFSKVVSRRRGGYCYELNSLFAWLLRNLGFAAVSYLSASLWHGARGYGPEYEHLVLLVEMHGLSWLVDVGHGDVFDAPILLQEGRIHPEIAADFCLRTTESRHWCLMKRAADDDWTPQYRFTLHKRCFAEFAERAAWTQESALSLYRNRTIVYRSIADGKLLLDTDRLTRVEGRTKDVRTVCASEYLALLRAEFGLELPTSTSVEALLAPDRRR